MTPLTADDLRALIAQGESETLEFKRSTAELTKAIRTVSALANTRGGHVIIGVAPDGRIIGMDIGQGTMDRVANEITGNTNPKIYPSVTSSTVDERAVIVISVEESDDKPHLAYNMAYKRVGATTVQMQRAEYERLLQQRRQLWYDQREVPEATLDDIDEAKVRWYLEQAARERGIPAARRKLPNGKIEEIATEETEGGILHWGRESGPALAWFREAITLTNIGSVYCELDHKPQALELHEQALLIFRPMDEWPSTNRASTNPTAAFAICSLAFSNYNPFARRALPTVDDSIPRCDYPAQRAKMVGHRFVNG